MPTDHRERLAGIRRFDQLVKYLHEELDWPIDSDDFDEVTFDYTPEELGIDAENAAKIQEIKRLRPLAPGQPWGIFFVKFAPKRLPVVALRRILGQVTLRKRASADNAERQAWATDDLLFISNYGDGDARQIAFAHFSKPREGRDLPTLKVLGWDNLDTPLRLDAVAGALRDYLVWPENDRDAEAWRDQWRAAFTLRHREVITTSKQLSARLAELARAIRNRAVTVLSIENESGRLKQLMEAFRDTLVHDLDEDSFADMYAQTIAYGLLSARITDPGQATADDFASHMRTNPFLRELLASFLRAGGRRAADDGIGLDFDELGVSEVVELLDRAKMEAVVQDFGDRNPQEDPVIHFYEHFLAAYDRTQKVERGVFYTPRPVVCFIVRSVDQLLRTEFGLPDGLADTTTWGEMAERHESLQIPSGTSPNQDFVQVLDPATGTGTFLVEAIDLIRQTMADKWKAQGYGEHQVTDLWNDYVPKHLLPRLHGYELLMAPYAIAHLKIGLKLHETGYRFESDERAQVYLANALEPPGDTSQFAMDFLPELAREAEAVNAIKRGRQFTIVMGNPPYSEKSKNNGDWITDLMDRYKETVRSEEKQIKSISNDYVKFLRLGHHLADISTEALVALITSNGYLDGPLFRDLRHSWVRNFRTIDVLNLHGSGRRGDAASDDENVFDILQGVCIAFGRCSTTAEPTRVTYSEITGPRLSKYRRLLQRDISPRVRLRPTAPLFLFCPSSAAQWSLRTLSLSAIFGTGRPRRDRSNYSGGFKTRQDRFTVGFDEHTLRQRISELADPELDESRLRERHRLCSTAHFEFDRARKAARTGALGSAIRRVRYRPFDDRPMIWSREVLCEPQEKVTRHLLRPNLCLVASRVVKDDAFRHVSIARGPVEVISLSNSTSTNAYMFPLYLYDFSDLNFDHAKERRNVNFSSRFTSGLRRAAGLEVADGSLGSGHSIVSPEDVLGYLYSVLHSPTYRAGFADKLLRDFAPIPLPGGARFFRDLVVLGSDLLALHLLESPKVDDTITDYAGPEAPVVGRVGWSAGTVWLDAKRVSREAGYRAMAPGQYGFHGVPEEVWDFQIGGYQVCHKWLKDRKGRTLSDEDIAHYQKVVVALNETIRLMAEIDEVIDVYGGWPGAFEARPDARPTGEAAEVLPFRPRTVEPAPEDRYVNCVPLVPLKVAAGGFGGQQLVDEEAEFDWVEVGPRRGLRPGTFVAQVIGKSMEPTIPDGAWCLFRGPVEGAREGKIVLVQLLDATDPETGQHYTVKRYRSEKATDGDAWRHRRIRLEPVNPEFDSIVFTDADEGELKVHAELLEVLGS